MSGGFVKLYGSLLLGSSLMEEAVETRWMFLCLAAAADEHGFVRCQTVGNAARLANLTYDQAHAALEALSSPDPKSTTPDEEGRRIVPVVGGWKVVNHAKYREMRTERQLKHAARQAEYKARRRVSGDSGDSRMIAGAPRSASPTLLTSVSVGEGSGEREDDRGARLLHESRVAKERRFYAFVARLAELQPEKDPPEIARELTGYTAKDGRKVKGVVRPEGLSDERLDRSLEDAQWWLDDLAKPGAKHGT